MSKNTREKSIINYKLHLILFLITASLWEPFYNFICLRKLNELSKKHSIEKAISPKNSAIANLLLAMTYLGLPFVTFRRFQLLHNYIKSIEPHLQTGKISTENNEDDNKPINCISPGKYVGYSITSFLLLGFLVTSLTISIYYIVQNPSWGSDLLLILLPIGIACFFMTVGFVVRTVKEEKKWIHAFNQIYNMKIQ